MKNEGDFIYENQSQLFKKKLIKGNRQLSQMKHEKQHPLIAHENKYSNLSISLSKRKEFLLKQELKNLKSQNLK